MKNLYDFVRPVSDKYLNLQKKRHLISQAFESKRFSNG